MSNKNLVDIKENGILKYDSQLLPILLRDNSSKQNIIWATDNYMLYGDEYGAGNPITISLITGENGNIIKPRVVDSLVKRWVNGTHQGNISPKYLSYYLDEFAFRFNRKLSTYRGKLFYRLIQQAVDTEPQALKKITKST